MLAEIREAKAGKGRFSAGQAGKADGCFPDFSDEPGLRRRPLLARRLLLIKSVIKNKLGKGGIRAGPARSPLNERRRLELF